MTPSPLPAAEEKTMRHLAHLPRPPFHAAELRPLQHWHHPASRQLAGVALALAGATLWLQQAGHWLSQTVL